LQFLSAKALKPAANFFPQIAEIAANLLLLSAKLQIIASN